jgi:DNA-binding SARP family transcriptional activator
MDNAAPDASTRNVVRPTGPRTPYEGADPLVSHRGLRIFAIGPFRAELDGVPLPLPPLARTILARLVLARGGLVGTDELYHDAWPAPAPTVSRAALAAVRHQVDRIRDHLAAGNPAAGPNPLLTDRLPRNGYRLVLDPSQVDVYRLEDLVHRAEASRDAVAADLLEQALAMWSDDPLQDLPERTFIQGWTSDLLDLRERALGELAAVSRELDRWEDVRMVFARLLASRPTDTRLHAAIRGIQDSSKDSAEAET